MYWFDLVCYGKKKWLKMKNNDAPNLKKYNHNK